jgi:hypothetical protein
VGAEERKEEGVGAIHRGGVNAPKSGRDAWQSPHIC